MKRARRRTQAVPTMAELMPVRGLLIARNLTTRRTDTTLENEARSPVQARAPTHLEDRGLGTRVTRDTSKTTRLATLLSRLEAGRTNERGDRPSLASSP